MLSIGTMGNGQGSYYVGLAAEDYYIAGGEPPGRWVGEGAELLGLSGQVERDQFLNLFAGFDAQGRRLVQNAGDPNRQPGWDLTFSAPKSVSTLWAVSEPETRRAIQDAHFQACKSALDFLEEGATTRRGKGGHVKEAAKLLVATFEHGTSRAQDPQLHSHCLILNIGVRPDGTTGTLESQGYYRSKMAAGALYRAELSRGMQQIGFEIERDGTSFAIKGAPLSLQEEFSKRRAEIEAKLDQSGTTGARAAAFAALDTRQVKKEHRAREELFAEWRETGAKFGFSIDEARTLREAQTLRGGAPRHDPKAELAEALKNATAKMAEEKSHFSERDLIRATAEDAQGRGLSAFQIRAKVKEGLSLNPEIVALGDYKGEARYTTRELLEVEKTMIATAERLSENKRHQADQRAFLWGILRAEERAAEQARERGNPTATPQMSDEQRQGLAHITKETGRVAILSGIAGSGKTFLLDGARETWEAQGFTVRGAAVAGKAARGLEEKVSIPSQTLARLLRPENVATLNERTVLVVDEAGMIGTRQMAELMAAIEKSGAKLVLVGAQNQIQSVEVGGPFGALEKHLGGEELTAILRQKEEWQRQAVKDFAEGRAESALRAFDARGYLHIEDDREGAKISLVKSWQKEGLKLPEENVIFAGTREEARSLNALAQEERRRAGLLGFRSAKIGGETIHEKDRVIFTKNSVVLGVQNGTTGTVKGIDAHTDMLRVKIDGGPVIDVPYRAYEEVSLGYALTTHKGQGMTAKNAFVLCGGSMADREISYVQASRASDKTELFTGKIMAWNPDRQKREDATLSELARQMSQSRQKDLAHTVLWEQSETRQQEVWREQERRQEQTL